MGFKGLAEREGLTLTTMQKLYLRLAPSLVAILELILLIAAALLMLRSRRAQKQSGFSASFERAFGHLAGRRGLAVLAVGAGVIALRVAFLPVLGIPQLRWNDEFSYLLAADSFAHGKITNPIRWGFTSRASTSSELRSYELK